MVCYSKSFPDKFGIYWWASQSRPCAWFKPAVGMAQVAHTGGATGSLVTLPTCSGRVASDSVVVFSLPWPWPHKNTPHQISEPLFSRVHLWPYLGVAVTLAIGFVWQVLYFWCFRLACDPTCRFCVAGAISDASAELLVTLLKVACDPTCGFYVAGAWFLTLQRSLTSLPRACCRFWVAGALLRLLQMSCF